MELAYIHSNTTWIPISDKPASFSSGNKAVECAIDPLWALDNIGYETMWIINSNNELEQWYAEPTTNPTQPCMASRPSPVPGSTILSLPTPSVIPRQSSSTSTWTKGSTNHAPIAENTSLATLSNSDYRYMTVFFQAPNTSIMQLPVFGMGASARPYPALELLLAQRGTRIGVVNPYNDTSHSNIFYQQGSKILNQKLTASSNGYWYLNGSYSSPTKSVASPEVARYSFALLLSCCSLCLILSNLSARIVVY